MIYFEYCEKIINFRHIQFVEVKKGTHNNKKEFLEIDFCEEWSVNAVMESEIIPLHKPFPSAQEAIEWMKRQFESYL